MPSPVRRQAAALTIPTVPITLDGQRMPTVDSPPAKVRLIDASSSRVMLQPPTAMQADGGEGDPDEFKGFTDQELQAKIKRLRSLHVTTPDGGEKLRRMVYRVEKELDRRRAARPRKGEEDAEEFKNFTDQDLKFKIKHLLGNHGLPDGGKKLPECACRLEKELDRRRAAGPRKVETGQRQPVQTPSVNGPYAFVPQAENTSNPAPLIDTEATDGVLNPFVSTNMEGDGATGTNLGAEEVEPTNSTCSGQKGENTGKRGKQSQIVVVLENNQEFKMKLTRTVVEEVKEAPKQEDRFRIEKCVAVLEEIKELTDVEKAKALKLFKCRMNCEIFMTTKSASVRLIWLKSEIYAQPTSSCSTIC